MSVAARRGSESGDTLIEVLFALAIFAMIAIGSITIMNQGTATAERSLEITLVREQMDAQAEAIRYVHQVYVAAYQSGSAPAPGSVADQWLVMKQKSEATVSTFGATDGAVCPAKIPASDPFILNARRAIVETTPPAATSGTDFTLPPYAQVMYDSFSNVSKAYGIWVESQASPANDPTGTGFIDFHIRACWSGAGSAAPVTLGTIVRLYEPR
jgi:type II secretory pathway pseudopilin PulG